MEPPAKQESGSPRVRESESSESGYKRAAAFGAPATYAAYASRKDVSVRVSVKALLVAEADELREEGYGHGV
jgi:hypothetical protein